MSNGSKTSGLTLIFMLAVAVGYFFLKPNINNANNDWSTTFQSGNKESKADLKPDTQTNIEPNIPAQDTENSTAEITPLTHQTAEQNEATLKQAEAKSRNIPTIDDKLNKQQKQNLANETTITQKGWLVYPFEAKDTKGKRQPTLKYVPHLDSQGNFHSVSVYDSSKTPSLQIPNAYPIPHTTEFPPITQKKANVLFKNSFMGDKYNISYSGKLVWLDSKLVPYHLYRCKQKVNKRKPESSAPEENKTFSCLINAYSGNIVWRD